MDDCHSSDAQDCCRSGEAPNTPPETSGQATSGRGGAVISEGGTSQPSCPTEETTNVHAMKGRRKTGTGDAGCVESRSKVGQISDKLTGEELDVTLLEDSQTKSTPAAETLAALRLVSGDLLEMRSLSEARRQALDLSTLGASAYEQFMRTGSVEDVDKAIEHWGAAVVVLASSQEAKPDLLSNLGCAYGTRFQCLGETSDLNNAIEFGAEAVSLVPDGHPEKRACFNNLGNAYQIRFGRFGALSDQDKAIESKAGAVAHTPDGHTDKPGYLNSLGVSYWRRFGRLGNLSDLNKAIDSQVEVVSLTPDGHPAKPAYLNSLGLSYETRFGRLGELADLNSAINSQAEAVSLSPDGHPAKPSYLNDLGVFYETRFRRLGNLFDLNKAIDYQTEAVLLSPHGHPNKSASLNNLGNSYQTRFGRRGELSDLNKAIESKEEAVSLAPDGHPNKPVYLNNLGFSYQSRFRRLGKLPDLIKAIEYLAEAVLLIPDGHPSKSRYLNNLGASYGTRFGQLGELSDLHKAINSQAEAVSWTPDDHPDKPSYVNDLGVSYVNRFRHLGELSDLKNAIEYQAQAVSLSPNDHPDKPEYLNSLGISYQTRFERLGELRDLNEAIHYQAEAVSWTPDDHPAKPAYLNDLGVAYETRFRRLGELLDLDQAISFQANAVSLTPDGHVAKPSFLNDLGISYETRFERLREPADLDKAIESQAKAVSLSPDNHPGKSRYLNNLGVSYNTRYKHLDKLSDLNQAIHFQSKAISLTPHRHPDKPASLSNLGISYAARFRCQGDLSDLNKAIESHAEAVSLTPDGHSNKAWYLNNLGISQKARFERLGELPDIRSAGSSFMRASQSHTGPPSARFNACRQWAQLSSLDPTSSPYAAYNQAMALLPQLVWVGTTISRRYELIAELSGFATEAASHAISKGEYELALEWLEAGRSIVWGQITQLRTPFEHLSSRDPKLAEELAAVGRQLEHAGSRSSLPSSPKISSGDLSQEANTHVQLALDWDRLLSNVRSIPGLEDFLCPPSASRLLSAVQRDPIALLNLHESRCDALVLRPNNETISHIPLIEFSFENAVSARRYLLSHVRDRKPGPRLNPLGSSESSLDSLWSGLVKPVLDSLGYTRKLPVEQLPHLTWCTTGLLSFLPLHAARSYDESQPGAFDLMITSYTPTISALLSSQPADQSVNCGILAVGQEHTPGLTSLPCTIKELSVIRERMKSGHHRQLEGDEATVERVLDGMDQFSWVHMACHGSQDADDPTQSAFHLHNGNLTLGAITKRSFKNKGLAFLSACQTATGDKKMPDEAVHLAAGMMMAGYPSVIGTMWSIADEDGPEVADRVYAEILADGKMDHTKSARALHQAIWHLREKVGRGNVARWAPFVHIGS